MKVEQLFDAKFIDTGHQTITEDVLTESFIEDTIKPMFVKSFSKKVENVSKYKSQYNSAIANARTKASADGVDTAAIEKAVKKKVKESNTKKISPSIFSTQLKEIFEELKEQNKIKVLTYSIIIFGVIFLLNTTMMSVLGTIVSPLVAMSITVVFLAPVIEEIGKYISIRNEMTGAFLISFNIGEYLSYMLQASTLGISLGVMAAIRLLPVAMHTMWTIIMRHKYQKDGSGPASTTVLHMLYNAIPIVGAPATFAYYQYLDTQEQIKKNKGVLEA